MTNEASTREGTSGRREKDARSKAEIDAAICGLEETGRFRVLRRLSPLSHHRCRPEDGLRCAIVVDTETTGLIQPGSGGDIPPSEIVSLAMVAIAYDPSDGDIKGVVGRFHRYRQPTHPIPLAATAIHGITDERVRGCSISTEDVADWIVSTTVGVQAGMVFGSRDEAKLPLLIAHNAAFDCRMVEYLFADAVAGLPWACSQTQIPWADFGYEGTRLAYLGYHAGFFYGNRHSALADADAVVELLRQPLAGRPAMAFLRDAARATTHRLSVITRYDPAIIAALKLRGYRWSNGEDGRPRAWCWEGDDGGLDVELSYLQRASWGGTQDIRVIDCFDRFSLRR